MTKGAETVDAATILADAVRTMRDAKIGCIVVVGKDKTPVGIFTESDLVRKVAEKGHGVLSLALARVMSKPLTIISPVATVWDAMTLMGRAGIRHLPVVENGRLVGIITERDVFRLVLSHQNLLLESVSESFPPATRDQFRGVAGHLGLGPPPARTKQS